MVRRLPDLRIDVADFWTRHGQEMREGLYFCSYKTQENIRTMFYYGSEGSRVSGPK